ncbi:MAG: hypothetical protein INR69_17935 [Mucilaginibacter polytrichastri]|nr:hypothetical protein [Mucilaginibacter polytrichastri]
MKKIFILTFTFFCLVKSGVLAQPKNFIDMPYVEVTGSADSLVTPNEIYIKIILSEKDSRDKNPLEDLENKMDFM